MSLLELWQSLALSAPEAWLILITAFVAGTARGFSGFGSAMIMAPVYASIFGPAFAVPVVLILEVLISLPLLASSVKVALYRTVWRLLAGAIIGGAVGLGVVALLPVDLLKTLVACIVLAFIPLMLFQQSGGGQVRPAGNPLTYLAGGASGLFGSISGMTGPPAVMLLLKKNLPPQIIRATLIIYFLLIDIVLVAGYGLWSQQIHYDWLVLTAVSLIPMIAGGWLGGRLFRLAPAHLFRNLTLLLVALAALTGLLV
ncbi:sulfite exporter TauE/SafE family protein [Marinobacter sp. X15-166B]|uniref:sulfite exporter TauE/SafE family protein n=1 Tax=Marinobacter sp. X15-166B TaxID=1897620 RepID=UPI00085CA599|nr:sulfite exporter TauE/SafE family protein [Marinobacter sp. X15-166B]OEY65065.1 hypothetical protein BG841_00325 [Marinobacter sp. X15-166B]